MRYGFLGQFPEARQIAGEIGAHGLPLWINALANQAPEAAIAPIRNAGMEVCQIGAFGYNPLSPNRDVQAQQERLVEEAILLVGRIGCPHVVINSGNRDVSGFLRGHADNFTDQALDEVAKALEKPLALAEEHGAKVVIEPMIHCMVSTPERFLSLKQRLKSEALRVNLDICNFLTLADMYNPIPAIERICGDLAGHYDLVHCKDLAVTEGVHIHIDETPLGTGMMDWAAALAFIARDLPMDGWFIYEHVKAAGDARRGAALLRQICAGASITLGLTAR
jgi:sugar phosphate isomerase/epimerase